MLKILKNNRAQTTLGEYLIVLFIVMGVITTMGVYFRRAFQARIYDATVYARDEVMNRTDGVFNGEIAYEYEPYYTKTQSIIESRSDQTKKLLQGGNSEKTIDDVTSIFTEGVTAPPREAP